MRKKTALITGGATGIGLRIAIELAEKDINLIINYRNSEAEARRLARNLEEKYGTVNTTIRGDITNYHDCKRIADEALQFSETVDMVIHNAGPYIHERKPMVQYEPEEWDYIINGNLNSVFYLSKYFIPKMRENHWGRVVTIGFDRVETAPGWLHRSAFAAAKSGLASLTKTIAMEEARNGITVNMICPGDIVGSWKESAIEDAIMVQDESSPVGRPGTGEDIARVVSFLVEESSSFITGSIIPVTGAKDVLGKMNRI